MDSEEETECFTKSKTGENVLLLENSLQGYT